MSSGLANGDGGGLAFALGAGSNCDGVTLSAKAPSCTVSLVFNPASAGAFDSTLTVTGRKLTASAALSGTGQAPVLPTLAINSPSRCSNCSPAAITFTVTMNRTSTSPVTFDWAATDGSALGPTAYWGTTCDGTADYTSSSRTGSGTIAAGSTTASIVFGLCVNGPAWHPMTFSTYFTVAISNPSGATIATGTGTGRITIS